VCVQVGDGGALDAWPEPIVSVRGSHHTLDVALDVAADARLRWVDEVVLGRHDEPSGTVVLRQRLTQCGVVVAVSQLHLGGDDRAGSFGQHGPYRVVASAVGRFDGPSAVEVHDDGRAVRCALGDGWATWSAVGHGHGTVRRLLAAVGLER
jgi:urease accessory protein